MIDCDLCRTPFKRVRGSHSRFCSVECRFLAKVNLDGPNGCWEWTGSTVKGYGQMGLNGGAQLAHRISYTYLVGPIPEGLTLDHLCFNPLCVNPAHLEPVTRAENTRRGTRRGLPGWNHREKTHCVHGHPFDEANTYIAKNGQRVCRACRNDRNDEYRTRKAARVT